MDTFVATSKGGKSTRGHTWVQLFVTNKVFIHEIPMRRKSEVLQALKQLAAKGLHPRFTSYPMAHELCMDEIHDIARVMQQWLSECA